MKIPSLDDLYGDELRAFATENAPPCPECGGSLVARAVDRHENYCERGTGDSVLWALEVYDCSACHQRIVRKLELDRETRAERDEEIEKALKRAELRQEITSRRGMFLVEVVRPGTVQRMVEDKYPRRREPSGHELLDRYAEQVRGSA